MSLKTLKIVLAIAGLIAGVISLTQIKSCVKAKQSIKTTKRATKTLFDSGNHYTTKNGIDVLRKEQTVADNNTLDILLQKQRDSLLKVIGAQACQLREFAKIDLTASGNIKALVKTDTIKIHDTINSISYTSSFSDSLIDATAIFNPEDMTMSLFYDLNLSINYVVTSKRKPRLFFWKKKKTYVDVFSNHKNVKIKSLQSVKVKPD